MPLIAVDEQQLAAAAGKIEQVVAGTQQLASLGSVEGGAAAAGGAQATAAIESFVRAWQYGLACLAQDGEHLAQLLRGAAQQYAAADEQIAQAAQQ